MAIGKLWARSARDQEFHIAMIIVSAPWVVKRRSDDDSQNIGEVQDVKNNSSGVIALPPLSFSELPPVAGAIRASSSPRIREINISPLSVAIRQPCALKQDER
jgi:hypothetical protein